MSNRYLSRFNTTPSGINLMIGNSYLGSELQLLITPAVRKNDEELVDIYLRFLPISPDEKLCDEIDLSIADRFILERWAFIISVMRIWSKVWTPSQVIDLINHLNWKSNPFLRQLLLEAFGSIDVRQMQQVQLREDDYQQSIRDKLDEMTAKHSQIRASISESTPRRHSRSPTSPIAADNLDDSRSAEFTRLPNFPIYKSGSNSSMNPSPF